MQASKQNRGTKSRPRHSSHRVTRGRDRRAEKRTDREALTIILHPALWSKQMEAA